MRNKSYRVIGLCCIVLLVMASVGFAQSDDAATPQKIANDIRGLLFDTQGALMNGDSAEARTLLADADTLYQNSVFSDISDQLDPVFEQASAAAQDGNLLHFAALRGQIWTTLLSISLNQTFTALEDGDAVGAQQWIALREYRPSTKFSRPGADGTLALQQLTAGTVTAEDALAASRADLLDTYQTQLNATLGDADEANARDFTMRRAEEVGLAGGYFEILEPMFAEQRGDEALAQMRAAFADLTAAAISDDDVAYTSAREQIDTLLSGFRAAPLSAEEAARRAGQLLRFIDLVPVEYGRGVRDGQVVSDLEIQEAQTFREGAVAAFADLQSTLAERDAEATARVADLLRLVQSQIQDVADPAALQSTVDEITTTVTDIMPAEWQNVNTDSDVDVILSVLDGVQAAVVDGQYALAESSRLEAYALMEMGLEQRLRGFAPELAASIESLFWGGTAEHVGLATLLTSAAPLSQVEATLTELRASLAEGQTFLSTANSAPAAVAGNAAIIVFREGLEAVLILASLLASLRTVEERKFRRPLVTGAALALVASAITWWAANELLTVLLPLGERLEAIVSFIAIAVLLLITNWFFHKVYWTGWMANFHARKRRIIGGIAVVTISQALGLILLGFTSVYREGFETVLFLQSLVLDAGIGTVLQGVALGLVGVAVVGLVTFALQVRLPYKKMLIVTGLMIGGVLLIMVGNTVHVMQTVGWLPITPIAGLQIPFWMSQWFGLFATWQSIGLQIVAGVFVVGSYFLAEHQTRTHRSASSRKPETAPKAAV
jgi:high-affinity iron transporter